MTKKNHSAAALALAGSPFAGSYIKDENGEGAALKIQVKQLGDAVAKTNTDVSTFLEKAAGEIKEAKTISAETKSALEAMVAKNTEAAEQFLEIQQQFAKFKDGGEGPKPRNLGGDFTNMDAAKTFMKDRPANASVSMQLKTISSNTTGSGDAGSLIPQNLLPGVITQPNRPMTVRGLIGTGRTTSDSIDFVRETGFTNAAAPVAEAATKPESDLTFELASAPVRTIAHWIRATKQVLADVPMLESYINGRLIYGLELEEEEQLLSGDGTGENIYGLIPQATPFQDSRAQPGDSRIDIVRRSMTQVRVAEYRADAIMMHPNDWEEIELQKTDDGAYVWARPGTMLMPIMWGLPVVETTALQPGEFLVGNFLMAATLWDREDARVEVATQDRDNFIRNLVTIRAEERLALTVYRPEAIIYGDFETIVSGG